MLVRICLTSSHVESFESLATVDVAKWITQGVAPSSSTITTQSIASRISPSCNGYFRRSGILVIHAFKSLERLAGCFMWFGNEFTIIYIRIKCCEGVREFCGT